MSGGAAERGLAVTKCVSDIEVADFVALDLEFSGLFLDTERDLARKTLSIEEYFQKCVTSIPEFLPLQLGICCCRSSATEPGKWELRSHEFNLWPQDRRIFSADLQSLRFLRTHGFDFNSFFEHAYPYTRLPPQAEGGAPARSLAKHQLTHATQVLSALRNAKVPLVFHNGLLDLMHLFDKFLGDLPNQHQSFGEKWVENFPILFDTRNIAQEGKYQVLKHSGGLNLEELHRHLSSMMSASIASSVSFERLGPLGKGKTAHGSSGMDATVTAEVFLMEMDLWLRHHDTSSGSRKRRRLAEAAAGDAVAADAGNGGGTEADKDGSAAGDAGADDAGAWTTVPTKKRARGGNSSSVGGTARSTPAFSSPNLLESHEVCCRFHNRLAIVGASPGYLDLGPGSAGKATAGLHAESVAGAG